MRTWRGTVGTNTWDDPWPAGLATSYEPSISPAPFAPGAVADLACYYGGAETMWPPDTAGSVVIPAVTLPSVPASPIRYVGFASRGSGNGESENWLNAGTGQAYPSHDAPSPAETHARVVRRVDHSMQNRWRDDPAGATAMPDYPQRAGGLVRSAIADPHVAADDGPLPDLNYIPEPNPAPRMTFAPRPANHRVPLAAQGHRPPTEPKGRGPTKISGSPRRVSRRESGIVVIPAGHAEHAAHAGPLRQRVARAGSALRAAAHRPVLISTLVLVVVLLAALANVTGAAKQAGTFSASAWHAVAGADASADSASTDASTSAQLLAPTVYDAQHYMDKYGFFQPGAPTPIAADKMARLEQMLPAAIKATAAYNKRYGQSVEPQLLLYWTYSEGISARINYSDCANEPSPPGKTYFTDIENCDHASFWQLGYGNQFGVIYVLRNAFTDLYGDPNDTQLVAKVGQSVLDFDAQAGTAPPCGGYSCTFPAKTIDEILTGVDLTTGVKAEDNWWASVLSRDPLINCYMIAHALTYFNHDATRNWVGCYYTTPCWQRDSDKLGDILAAWPDLVKAAGIQG